MSGQLAATTKNCDNVFSGEVAEWPIAPVLKTGVPQGTGSSNLPLSAHAAWRYPNALPLF